MRLYNFKGALFLDAGDGWLYLYDAHTRRFQHTWFTAGNKRAMKLVGVNYRATC